MKPHSNVILLLVTIFFANYSFCQNSISGRVIDKVTKEPLAFVSILFNDNAHLGTSTDIDGKFYYSQSQKIKTISCSYLGYKNYTLSLDSTTKENKILLLELAQSAFNLHEIIIREGENPANKIIRRVIENKAVNNPENISSFKYSTYNKSIYDFSRNDTAKPDNTLLKMEKVLKGGHLLIMESVTERKFIAPDISEETIIGTKVSGFKHPSFAALSSDIQPFSFYKEIIKIFDINYLNPISDGSLKKYQFHIEDTLYQNNDSTFIISFKPLPHSNFEGLKGLLYINTNRFAIQNVIAEPYEKGLIDVKIQQQYVFIDNKQWFPQQLNFEMVMREYPSKKIGTSANGRTYIENIELYPTLNKKDFSLESIQIQDLANDRDSLFWSKYRTESLNKKELTTYQVIDSLGEKNKFEALLHVMEKIAINRIPVKFIDLDISKIIVNNKFEGTRLGLGGYTNEKVFKLLSIGGFLGYGLNDHQWKYGGEFIFTVDKNKEVEVNGIHQNTLVETGKSGLNYFNRNLFDFKGFMAFQMDRIEQNSLAFGFRAFRYAKFNFKLNHTIHTPQYNYEFIPMPQQKNTSYTNSELTINLRYAYKEKLIHSLNQRVSIRTKYPTFYLTYSKGIKNFHRSEFNFNKMEVCIEESFFTKKFGETKFRIAGGYIDKSLPYGLLFTGEGSFDKDFPVLIKNSFQTITPYEFLSDRYIDFHFSHNFGSLLFKIRKFSPIITFHQNVGYGMLSHKENHLAIQFKTKEKGMYESGFQIDNIIRAKYLNIIYLSFGAGVYYRYGPYSLKKTEENLAVKLSMTFTTK